MVTLQLINPMSPYPLAQSPSYVCSLISRASHHFQGRQKNADTHLQTERHVPRPFYSCPTRQKKKKTSKTIHVAKSKKQTENTTANTKRLQIHHIQHRQVEKKMRSRYDSKTRQKTKYDIDTRPHASMFMRLRLGWGRGVSARGGRAGEIEVGLVEGCV